MTVKKIITGHEAEMAQLEKAEKSPVRRALTIKLAGEGLASNGEILRLAALGLLQPNTDNVFNETISVEDQIKSAERMVLLHMENLSKAIHAKYEIVLEQEAYLGDNGDYHAAGYLASEDADDETGPTVKVTWSTLEGAEEMDDESGRCDWAKAASIMHFRLGDITEMSTIRS